MVNPEKNKGKSKNPLRRRYPREIRSDLPRYLIMFLIFTITIAVGSGMSVGGDSLIAAYQESFSKYHVEDGYFETDEPLTDDGILSIEKQGGIALYQNFYSDVESSSQDTIRVFQNRTKVDLACLMDGSMPSGADEIALDRMYADNNNIGVGDTITLNGHDLREIQLERRLWSIY
jgi:putative ABC transport system permease protein